MSFRATDYNIRFYNDQASGSGSTVPAYGIMRRVGWKWDNGLSVPKMRKMGTFFERFVYINGPTAVPSGKDGCCGTCEGAGNFVFYNEDDATDSNGDDHKPTFARSWGAAPNDWRLSMNFPGFTMEGGLFGGEYNDNGNDDDKSRPALFIARQETVNVVWIKSDKKLFQGGRITDQPVQVGFPTGYHPGDSDFLGEFDSGLVLPEVYDRLIDPDNESGWFIDTGAWMLCTYFNGFWYVTESSRCAQAPTS